MCARYVVVPSKQKYDYMIDIISIRHIMCLNHLGRKSKLLYLGPLPYIQFDAQTRECVTVVGKLEEGIEHSGLVVCEFHQAPLDCYDDPCEVRHPKSLLKKQNCMYIVE